MKFMRQYLLSLLLTFAMVGGVHAAADVGNTAVISPVDSSNGSGTCPSWLGSAAPSTLDDAGRCLQGAIAREWQNRSFAVTSSGTAPTFVVTYTVAPAAYRTGQVYSFIAHAAAVGSETANINTLGAKNLKKVVAGSKTALAAGDFYTGDFLMFAYDGTDLVWLNPYPNAARTTDANVFTATQTVTSTDAGALGPVAVLRHDSASPAAADVVGRLRFDGEDSAGNTQEYGAVEATISDATTTQEDGSLDLYAQIAGTRTRYLTAGRDAAGTATANAIGLPLGRLSFPASQSGSADVNTLDDYEEGTFTPTIVGTTIAGAGTYTTQVGSYTKIGNRVFVEIHISWSAHTGTGNMEIGALPFTVGANSSAALAFWDLTFTGLPRGYFSAGTTSGALVHGASTTGFTPIPIDSAATIIFSGTYRL